MYLSKTQHVYLWDTDIRRVRKTSCYKRFGSVQLRYTGLPKKALFVSEYNSLNPKQNGHHFADVIYKCICFTEYYFTLIKFLYNEATLPTDDFIQIVNSSPKHMRSVLFQFQLPADSIRVVLQSVNLQCQLHNVTYEIHWQLYSTSLCKMTNKSYAIIECYGKNVVYPLN